MNLLELEEYETRKMRFSIDVKNNIGIPTSFFGTRKDFDIKYDKYFKCDSLGKIIGITSLSNEDYLKAHNVNDETLLQVQKNIAYMEKFPLGRDLTLDLKRINKRYKKYL